MNRLNTLSLQNIKFLREDIEDCLILCKTTKQFSVRISREFPTVFSQSAILGYCLAQAQISLNGLALKALAKKSEPSQALIRVRCSDLKTGLLYRSLAYQGTKVQYAKNSTDR